MSKVGMKKWLAFVMVAVIMVAVTGCGSETLQSYAESNESIKTTIETMSSAGMEVEIDKNNLIYSYQYPSTYEKEVVEAMAPQLEELLGSLDSTFEGMITTLESETGIDGVTITVQYKNGDGSVIYEKNYE